MEASQSTPVDYDPFAGGELSGTCRTTEAQKEVFTAAHWGRDASCAYNEAFTLRFRGALDVTRLFKALQELTVRHEALRMTVTPDGLTACIAKEPPIVMTASEATEAALALALEDEVETPFDLVQGPLIRARLVRLAPEDHVLVVCAHHLVCDGWSIAVLAKDLAALYSGRPLGDDAGRYSDYARREHERRASGGAQGDEAYWLALFAGGAPVLDLPLDRPRPPVRPYRSRREDYELPVELIRKLKALGAKNGTSFFTVLLAGYHALLHRLTGHEEIVVGVPAAGQSVEGDAALVGHCVNLLPIPARFAATTPFSKLLKDLRTTVLDAFDHQRFTYGSLLTKLKIERDPSRLPLVSVIFNLDQSLPEDAYEFRGLKTAFGTVPRRYENFELFFNIIGIDGKTTIECQYLSDLFTPETVRSRLASYVQLLEAAAATPDAAVGALGIVPPDELRALEAWNSATARPLPARPTIHGMVEAQAQKTPQKIAVRCGDRTLTYAELIKESGQLARHLRNLGVKPGTMVGVSVERSLGMLVALLATVRAGGAYVPIDPAFPKERIGFMLEDAECSVLLVTKETHGAMPATKAAVIDLGDVQATVAALEPLPAVSGTGPADATAADIAYVIFTSGSTGRPKGVLCPHQGVASLLQSMLAWPGLSGDDKQLGVTTISFDVHVPDLYLPLVCGAELVIATKEDTLDGERLRAVMDKHAITFMQATPATWRLLLDAGWPGSKAIRIVSTGEPLPRDLAATLLPKVGKLWNMYGPTETTVYSTGCQVVDASQPILIGRPVANTTLHIVNELGVPCPVGVPGELLIGGVGVTRGYLKRPDLTAEKFVMGPTGAGRVYKTGDLARFLADGSVECLGRNDHQVKVRGYRIELGEIEAELAKRPGIRSCAVGVRDRAAGDRRLCAWYTTQPGAEPDAKALREGLRAFLPEYMVPQHLIAVDALPLTPSGKVDRQRLPSPFADAKGAAPAAGAKPTARAPGTALELSVIQQKVLGLEAERDGLTIFNLPTGFRIFGPFQIDACAAALGKFVNRHEALRTAFAGGKPVVSARVAFRPDVVDLSAQAKEAQERRLADDFARAADTPTDLARAPLFQATIYKIAAHEHVLFIMAHQATWDGWSFDIFVKELSKLYDAETEGREADLPALPFGYADYALWHNRHLESPQMKEQLAYWRERLASPPPPLDMAPLMGGRQRPAVFSFKGHSVSFFMPRDLANALTAVGRETGATFFQVLLAAYKVLLFRLTGATDLAVTTPVRGREEGEVLEIVGTFVNQIVVRTRIDPHASFLDYLKTVRQAALEGMANDALPFDHLVKALGADKDKARVPLAQCNFSFQDARARNTAFGKLPFKQLNIEPLTSPCDLNFWVKESNENLAGSMNYASDLFDEATMRRVLASYDALLAAIVQSPRAAVKDLTIDPAAAKALPVSTWVQRIHELEQALTGVEAIKDVAATIQFDDAGAPRLTVHFTLQPGEFVTATDLRKHARTKLGDALVPQTFIELDQMPRHAGDGGKVDKIKLLSAARRGETEAAGTAAPKSKAEQALATIWAELLGIEDVPANGNFFELGGHSLLAIQMIGRVEKDTGVKLNRMAVTLNTLGQIAKTMGLDEAPAAAPAPRHASPADIAPAAEAPEQAKDEKSGGLAKLWRKLRG